MSTATSRAILWVVDDDPELRQMRDRSDDLPVLMLTPPADGVDRIIGLEQGADASLAKPFLPRELTARIEAVLRRRQLRPAALPSLGSSRSTSGLTAWIPPPGN